MEDGVVRGGDPRLTNVDIDIIEETLTMHRDLHVHRGLPGPRGERTRLVRLPAVWAERDSGARERDLEPTTRGVHLGPWDLDRGRGREGGHRWWWQARHEW